MRPIFVMLISMIITVSGQHFRSPPNETGNSSHFDENAAAGALGLKGEDGKMLDLQGRTMLDLQELQRSAMAKLNDRGANFANLSDEDMTALTHQEKRALAMFAFQKFAPWARTHMFAGDSRLLNHSFIENRKKETALPTCSAEPSTTPEKDLVTMAGFGLAKCFGEDLTKLHFSNNKTKYHDDNDAFVKYGGNEKAHTYGEVTLEAMEQILQVALQISLGTETDVFQHAGDFKFYDLGSGFGKFPMFASFMGFKQSTGIELDSRRAKFAAERWEVMKKELPSCADKLHYMEDSFLTNDEWAKGKEKRVIFMDSVCWESFWPELTAKVESAEWGNGTVIVSLGQKTMGQLQPRAQITVTTSWAEGSFVTFFTKCQGDVCGQFATL